MDKKVITIDLNPMSRTAQNANVTIVDNIIRSLPLVVKEVNRRRKFNKKILYNMIKKYNNRKILKQAIQYIKR